MDFPLRERVIVIAGPLSTTVQSIMSGLTAEGADVALLDTDAAKAERFCAQLSDQREVHAQHGRAVAITTDLSDAARIRETVGSVAQSFGGVDVLIDAQIFNEPSPLKLDAIDIEWLDRMIVRHLRSSLLLTQVMAGFLKGRKKGRIIFLMNDSLLQARSEDALAIAIRSGLSGFSAALARQMLDHNVTVNTVTFALTEEYLLAHEPGILLKESLEHQRKADAHARITEPDRITSALGFLISAAGTAVTGQTIRIC